MDDVYKALHVRAFPLNGEDVLQITELGLPEPVARKLHLSELLKTCLTFFKLPPEATNPSPRSSMTTKSL